ncbi:MAG: hypothetical protein C4558_07795 [Dehalococcoidia bacterium]|nr:MAG: hypothetical protein C4558_07795 [Dehalococcoidia bacterium]
MNMRPLAAVLATIGLSLALIGCRGEKAPPPATSPELKSVGTLQSYRWTTELQADSSLFDQSLAPEALRSALSVLRASVKGDRVTPDRERALTTVKPVAIEPRESITIGDDRWNRIGNGPWRVGGEAFPAARAYFGGTASLSARAILEPGETSEVARLREELGVMPYRKETVTTGPARRYTLRPEQVTRVVGDASLNPFPVLKTLPHVSIDLWVDEQRKVLSDCGWLVTRSPGRRPSCWRCG